MRRVLNVQDRFLWFATEIYVLFLALKDPRAPLISRLLAVIGTLYVLSPVDIFPDLVPLVGVIDDVAMIPVVITTLKIMIPGPVLEAARRHATSTKAVTRVWWAIVIFSALLVIIWVAAVIGLILVAFGVL
jgi:uncharacterized membrane protein YkvA (DUF1232 family)